MSGAENLAEVFSRCLTTTRWAEGMCGQFCARMYGYSASGYVDALAQWNRTPSRLKHPGGLDPEPGALVFWGGGSAGHGHVAVADGAGFCWSIDIAGAGTVSRVPVVQIHAQWGLPYLGWSRPYFQGQEWSPAVIYGLDVASFQSSAVPNRTPSDNKPVDFCLIKATQGTSYINPRMAAQAESARDQGMVVGFYHFLERGNINAQCDYFVQHADSLEGDIFAIDWETNPATSTYPSNAEKDAAIRRVQALRPGHRVLLYCNTSFWKGIDTTSFAGDGLWIATAGYAAGRPPITSGWALHQYSTAGSYDHNVAQFSSRADLRAWAEEGVDDMALNADDKAWILANVPKAIFTTDGILESPADAADHATNPFWTFETYVKDTGSRTRSASSSLADILAQAKANGAALSAVRAVLDSLDLSQVPAEVAAKIESLKLVVTVEEQP
jgi:GH25 family lysozyme M1 (1,4-beta-N-acetylmuramidase)